MATSTSTVKQVGNGVEIWQEFKIFGWRIVAMANAIVGALADGLDSIV